MCRCACHGIPMEARGQFCGVSFLLVPFCGVQGLNLGHQACMASVLPAEPCHQPYINTSDTCCQVALPEIASHPLVPYLPLAIGYPFFLPSTHLPIRASIHPPVLPSISLCKCFRKSQSLVPLLTFNGSRNLPSSQMKCLLFFLKVIIS